MLKLLSEFLRNPRDLVQDEYRQRIVILSLFSLLFVCVLLSMVRGKVRRINTAQNLYISPTPVALAPTQTKWWVRRKPSETPTNLIPGKQTLDGATEALQAIRNCPTYATDFKPETFGYISLYPPYKNLVRSGAGKNYSTVGFIETGGWVRILAAPICDDDGYVWLNVQSAAGSSSWTAGGHKAAQWVIPCPDPNKKCSEVKPVNSASGKPNPNKNGDGNSNNITTCVSDKLAVGLDAQVSPIDLLVVRSEPFTGNVIGHIAPLAVINIIDGPKCAGGAIWWKVHGLQRGWAVENNLRACPKEGDCYPWKDEQVLH